MDDLDISFKNFIRADARYRYGKVMGLKQNEDSLSEDVLIKDTTLSNRLKNSLVKFNVVTIGDLEKVTAWNMMDMKGLGEKLQRELGVFEYVNKLRHHRD